MTKSGGLARLHSLPSREQPLGSNYGHGMAVYGDRVAHYIAVPWLPKEQASRYDDNVVAVSAMAPTRPPASERRDGSQPQPGDKDYVYTQSELVRDLLEREALMEAVVTYGRTSLSFEQVKLQVEAGRIAAGGQLELGVSEQAA